MHKVAIAGVVMLCLTASARAENSACWGDEARTDISCTALTERFLLSLRGQTVDAVRKAMKAPGRDKGTGMHFVSNYTRGEKVGSGELNVSFEGGRATSVYASVDQPKDHALDFIWSAYAAPPLGDEINRSTIDFRRPPFCSDFSARLTKCSTGSSIDAELTKLQMQGNLPKSDLLEALKASCNPSGEITVSDPAQDCARLRDKLQ